MARKGSEVNRKTVVDRVLKALTYVRSGVLAADAGMPVLPALLAAEREVMYALAALGRRGFTDRAVREYLLKRDRPCDE